VCEKAEEEKEREAERGGPNRLFITECESEGERGREAERE
jgi:hypothetical protein